MLARLFLIESSSKLTRIGIKARSSSILGRLRPLILELLALEWRKFHTFELEYLDQLLCVVSSGLGEGCIRFWDKLDQNSGFHGNWKPPLTYNGESDDSTFSGLFFIRSWKSASWLIMGKTMSLDYLLSRDLPWLLKRPHWPWHIGLRWAIVAFGAICFKTCHSKSIVFWCYDLGSSLTQARPYI